MAQKITVSVNLTWFVDFVHNVIVVDHVDKLVIVQTDFVHTVPILDGH